MSSTVLTFPQSLAPVQRWARSRGLEIYVVGGWVRDSLLGLPAWDADLSGPHLPEELMACLPEDGSVTLTTRDAGLGTVELHAGGEIFEYTAFRRESYRPGGAHRPTRVTLGATMAEDALRRDFRVNAMYVRITDGQFFDPTGGMQDLPRRVLSTTRDPEAVLNEDGLRLLRLVRQSAELEFSIDPATYTAAKERISYLSDIAPERLREELRRILCADLRHPEKNYAASPVLHGLELLQDLSAWQYLCPEGQALCCDPARMKAASLAPAQDALRLACLWHGMQDATLEACMQALRFSREDAKRTAFLCAKAALPLDETEFRLTCAHSGLDYARDLTTLRGVLRRCGLSPADAREPQWLADMQESHVPFSLKQLQISGSVLARLAGGPSPLIGQIKARLWDHVILSPLDNTPGRLEALARDIFGK